MVMYVGRIAARVVGPMGEPLPALEIDLLGGFRVRIGTREVPAAAWRLSKARTLLKILALHSAHRLPREQVLETLWSDLGTEAAANNLHQAVHTLRRALGASREHPVITVDRAAVSIDPAVSVHTDVDAFEAAIEVARTSGDPTLYEAAAALYTGDLLPDDLYEDWAAGRREYLHERYIGLLLELARVDEVAGRLDRALDRVQMVAAHDPTREEAHALLMRLFALQGRREAALRQYTLLRESLWNALGVEPDRETERLYAEILSGGFGRTAPPPPLPVPLTTFIGRDAETKTLRELVARHRLVTMVGPGGSGKTRLALATASDGNPPSIASSSTFFADLAPLSDADIVPEALLRACGLQAQGDAIDALAVGLGSRHTLLVLDNCEHLLPALADLVAALLSRCPGLHVLATSREPLSVSGETLFRVTPLSLPQGQDEQSVLESEAGRLFLERAADRAPGFTLEGNAGAVAEICRRLDGMPLAIELAAARVGALPVGQIAARLDDALALLETDESTDHPRHRALRATLDWSYSQLAPDERMVFQRLGVFLGGFSLLEAEWVCAGVVERRAVLGLLVRLVDRSLLVAATAGQEARFHLSELVRQYARELLELSDGIEVAHERHAEAYLALAERARPALRGPAQQEWMERLALDHDNLRAALDWFVDAGEPERASILAGALWRFWQMHGDISDGIRRLEMVRAMEGPVNPEVRGRVLNGLTALVYRHGDLRRAATLSEQALKYARAHGLRGELAAALNNRGAMVHGVAGSADEAIPILEESLALHRALEDALGTTMALRNLGRAYDSKGRCDLALRCFEEVLAVHRTTGDTFGQAETLNSMALAAINLREYTRARSLLEEALPFAEQIGDPGSLANILNALAQVSISMGEPDEVDSYLDRAMALHREVGDERGQAWVTIFRMQAALMRDDRAMALKLGRQAIGMCLTRSYRSEAVPPILGMAQLSATRPEVAARLLGAAEGALARLGQHTGDWESAIMSSLAKQITSEMGADRFAALRAEGHALSDRDAAALALTVAD